MKTKLSIILVLFLVGSIVGQDVPISVTTISRNEIEKLPDTREFLDILKINAAVNSSSTTNHADYSRRSGISIGVSTDASGSNVPLIKNVSFLNTFRYEVGVQFDQFGSKLSTKESWEGGKSSSEINLRLNYLSFPFTFAFDLLFIPCELYLMSGFSPRFLVGGTEGWKYTSSYQSGGMEYSDTQKGEEDIKEYTNSFDLGFVIGIGKPFSWKNHNFNLEATYEKGFLNVWDNSDSDSNDSKLKNNSFKLRASYIIPIKK